MSSHVKWALSDVSPGAWEGWRWYGERGVRWLLCSRKLTFVGAIIITVEMVVFLSRASFGLPKQGFREPPLQYKGSYWLGTSKGWCFFQNSGRDCRDYARWVHPCGGFRTPGWPAQPLQPSGLGGGTSWEQVLGRCQAELRRDLPQGHLLPPGSPHRHLTLLPDTIRSLLLVLYSTSCPQKNV